MTGKLVDMLRVFLERQRQGLAGHLGEISSWLQKDDNAWLSKTGKGKYGWEELPYWLRGYIELAYVTKDPQLIAESHVWIQGVLGSQRENGDFGPDSSDVNFSFSLLGFAPGPGNVCYVPPHRRRSGASVSHVTARCSYRPSSRLRPAPHA